MGIGPPPSPQKGVEPQTSNTNAAIKDNITFLFINFLLLLRWNWFSGNFRLPEKAGVFREKDSGFASGKRRRANLAGFQNTSLINSMTWIGQEMNAVLNLSLKEAP